MKASPCNRLSCSTYEKRQILHASEPVKTCRPASGGPFVTTALPAVIALTLIHLPPTILTQTPTLALAALLAFHCQKLASLTFRKVSL